MTRDEARNLLPLYLDGKLDPIEATELEDALDKSPELRSEMRALEDKGILPLPSCPGDSGVLSEELLSEALAPLRPSRSARMRLTDALADVHRHAEHVANTLPEAGWRLFRLCFVFVALATALVFTLYFQRPNNYGDERIILRLCTIGTFVIGVALVLGGSILAQVEAVVMGLAAKRELKPTRLEVLTLEVFGVFSVLMSGGLYLYQLWY